MLAGAGQLTQAAIDSRDGKNSPTPPAPSTVQPAAPAAESVQTLTLGNALDSLPAEPTSGQGTEAESASKATEGAHEPGAAEPGVAKVDEAPATSPSLAQAPEPAVTGKEATAAASAVEAGAGGLHEDVLRAARAAPRLVPSQGVVEEGVVLPEGTLAEDVVGGVPVEPHLTRCFTHPHCLGPCTFLIPPTIRVAPCACGERVKLACVVLIFIFLCAALLQKRGHRFSVGETRSVGQGETGVIHLLSPSPQANQACCPVPFTDSYAVLESKETTFC